MIKFGTHDIWIVLGTIFKVFMGYIVYISCLFIFQRNVNASGVVPQISLIMGPCAGKYQKTEVHVTTIFPLSYTKCIHGIAPSEF